MIKYNPKEHDLRLEDDAIVWVIDDGIALECLVGKIGIAAMNGYRFEFDGDAWYHSCDDGSEIELEEWQPTDEELLNVIEDRDTVKYLCVEASEFLNYKANSIIRVVLKIGITVKIVP